MRLLYKQHLKKTCVLIIIIFALFLVYYWKGQGYISTDFFLTLHQESPVITALIFFATYITITGLSLPGATILTIAGGFIFGFPLALLIISFASSIGATLAFLISRFLLKTWVQKHFTSYMDQINKRFREEGAFYLFTLRLIPIFPFFIINMIMGLLPIRVRTFYWISQLGMLPGTAIYINAGAQAGQITELSLNGVLTPIMIVSLVLLGTFPLVAKKTISLINNKKKSYNTDN